MARCLVHPDAHTQHPPISTKRFIADMFKDFLKPAANESQKTLNKCETRNKTVFHTRLRHPETINSVPLNSVLRIKQTGV